jgi:hypothetical protein
MREKYIIVNWNWKSDYCSTKNKLNLWQCREPGYKLICINEKTEIGVTEIINNVGREHEILILLHKNPPNEAEEATRGKIADQYRSQNVVVQLFEGGQGPIYFSSKSLLGILGDSKSGSFPDLNLANPDNSSTFIIDKPKRLVKEDHLAYIWRNYCEMPFRLVHKMTEDLFFQSYGFDFESTTKIQDHLKEREELWLHLISFAAGRNAPQSPTSSSQHTLVVLEEYLRNKNEERLLDLLSEARRKVQQLVNDDTTLNMEDLQAIYEALERLYQSLPYKFE